MANFSQALAEAYASASIDEIIYHTIEISHPSFTSPVYLVQGNDDVVGRIDVGADTNSGQVVQFIGAPWDFKLPEVAEDTLPQLELTLGNVSREITTHLKSAAQQPSPIKLIYRVYTDSTLLDGPQIDPPLSLEITSATADVYQVTCTANMENVFNSRFPSKFYDQKSFPSLAYSA